MRIEEANDLLKPGYLPFEAGWKRYDDGLLVVAARSSLANITGEMVEWWFTYVQNTEQYTIWHKDDHVFSDWIGERGTGKYIGGTHIAHERLGGDEIHKLKINFLDPANILDVSKFEELGVTAVHARLGIDGMPGYAAKMVHFIRDTDYGCEMRSRFWLGYFEGNDLENNLETRLTIYPDELGEGLCKHCHEEMSNFNIFLPELYEKETGKKAKKNTLNDLLKNV
ncbi:DAPG hydrolase family protein [Chitinophaga flava]|uniref:DAPG hydrolase PhiG domain-containing protein n=1 Tax=Chitinophaga flava TaxID=2259036 RepID=A0A365XUQ3_9BACT|nr:hypothetical protein [Chitinophaga flava]RBL89434.1 hypothetical protein DF182_23235 [Chitinophaga flava]